MESVVGFSSSISSLLPKLACSSRGRNACPKAHLKVDSGGDVLLQSAIHKASLRHQESLRPVPLFVDPYAAAFTSSNGQSDREHEPHPYCLATKFVDDRLAEAMKNNDGLKQVVLFSDGMDARPYRISWPLSTLIFDVSPDTTFQFAARKLDEVHAKVSKGCLLLHIPFESGNLQQQLRAKGFNGNRPSIWVLQGLPIQTLVQFEDILLDVDSLGVEGCLILGELPAQFAEKESDDARSWLEKVMLRHGFRLLFAEITDTSSKESLLPGYKSILFVAEHLRLSDDQMELWRKEFERIEDEGDEEGFEEL
uniref:S-adenosyl-L-methionine-dependent methyltransferase n=1 Tax=Kalanchoe fedtschenkoi TaxID=63787 RepID=A0A7N0TAB3_KALFE